MSTYYVDFKNETSRTYVMAVYQQLPDSVGLDSVAWKRATAPKLGICGVKWDVDYNVALADYTMAAPSGVYMSSQILPTILGKKWKCIWGEGCQELVEDGEGTPGHILISNNSGFEANLGIGMDNQGSIFKRNVMSGENAQFRVEPTYYIGLFRNVVLGEVISGDVIVGPMQLKFSGNMNCALLRLYVEGSTIKYQIEYSMKGSMSIEHLLAREAMATLNRNPAARAALMSGSNLSKLMASIQKSSKPVQPAEEPNHVQWQQNVS